MKFGASSWPFQWDPPYEDCIRRIAGLGFKAIELIAWNPDYLRDYYTDAKIKNLKSALAGEGIALSQFVSTPHDLSSADTASAQAAVSHWKRTVDVGAELGAPIINMVSAHRVRHARHARKSRASPRSRWCRNTQPRLPRGVDWDQNFNDYVAGAASMRRSLREGRRHDVHRAASGPLRRQHGRRAPAARARELEGGWASTSTRATLSRSAISRTSRSTGSARTSSIARLGQ